MSFVVALYTGEAVHELELVGVTSDQETVRNVASQMLCTPASGNADPARAEVVAGRRRAMEMAADHDGGEQ